MDSTVQLKVFIKTFGIASPL